MDFRVPWVSPTATLFDRYAVGGETLGTWRAFFVRRGIIGPMKLRKLRISWSVAWGIAAVLLIVGLPILGWCSWREATGKEIQAAFVFGVFSPIRYQYQSVNAMQPVGA